MSITVLSSTCRDSFYSATKTEDSAKDLASLIKLVRIGFEDNVDAIAVIRDDNVVGLWINEPDIDCDSEDFFEVKPAYEGQQFNLYRPWERGFWNAFAYHFGIKYIPTDVSFTIKPRIAA